MGFGGVGEIEKPERRRDTEEKEKEITKKKRLKIAF